MLPPSSAKEWQFVFVRSVRSVRVISFRQINRFWLHNAPMVLTKTGKAHSRWFEGTISECGDSLWRSREMFSKQFLLKFSLQ